MFRKLWLGIGTTLVMAIIAGSSLTGIAFAQSKVPADRRTFQPAMVGAGLASYSELALQREDYGQVLDVSMNGFSIRTRAGQELNFRFDDNTRFVDGQKQALKASNLKIGEWVTVYAPHVDRFEMGAKARLEGKATFQFSRQSRVVIHPEVGDMDDAPVAAEVIIASQAASPAPAAPKNPAPAAPKPAAPAPQVTPAAPATSPTAPAPTPTAPAPKPYTKP